MNRIYPIMVLVALQVLPSASSFAQSTLYPGWATDKQWIAKNDESFLPIRKECDKFRRSLTNYDLKSNWPARADAAFADWNSDQKSPLKLFRASYYLSTARGVNYKYQFEFDNSRTVRVLCDAWRAMPSQKSYEFARYGFMFVSAFDPDRLSRYRKPLRCRGGRAKPSPWVRSARAKEEDLSRSYSG